MKISKKEIFWGLIVVLLLAGLGLLPFVIVGSCPYGQDANGNCIFKSCETSDKSCQSYNIKSQCINAAHCPDIVTTATLHFGTCNRDYGDRCNMQCITNAVRAPNGDWSCTGQVTNVDTACINRELLKCEQQRIDWLTSQSNPTPTAVVSIPPGDTPTPTPYPTIPGTVSVTPIPDVGVIVGGFELSNLHLAIIAIIILMFVGAYLL